MPDDTTSLLQLDINVSASTLLWIDVLRICVGQWDRDRIRELVLDVPVNMYAPITCEHWHELFALLPRLIHFSPSQVVHSKVSMCHEPLHHVHLIAILGTLLPRPFSPADDGTLL